MAKFKLIALVLVAGCSGGSGLSSSAGDKKNEAGGSKAVDQTGTGSGTGTTSASASDAAIENAVSSIEVSGAFLTCARDPAEDEGLSNGDRAVSCGFVDAPKLKKVDTGHKVTGAGLRFTGEADAVAAPLLAPKAAGSIWQITVAVPAVRLPALVALALTTDDPGAAANAVIAFKDDSAGTGIGAGTVSGSDGAARPAGGSLAGLTSAKLSDFPGLAPLTCSTLESAEYILRAQHICQETCSAGGTVPKVGHYLSCAAETLTCACIDSTVQSYKGTVVDALRGNTSGNVCAEAQHNGTANTNYYSQLNAFCQTPRACAAGSILSWLTWCDGDSNVTCACVTGNASGAAAQSPVSIEDLKKAFAGAPPSCDGTDKGVLAVDLDKACDAYCKASFKAGWAAGCDKKTQTATCSCVR